MFPIFLLIVFLTFINAFFAASEMALVSINPSQIYRMKLDGVKNAETLEDVTKDSTKYLSTIQVAITFAGFLSSAFAGSKVASSLVAYLATLNITLAENIAVIIITVLLSYFTLVFGELVPKRIALSKSTKLALFSAPIIKWVMIIFKPFVYILTLSTRIVVSVFGIRPGKDDQGISEKDIREMIVYGHIKGLLQQEERDMLERIFILDDLTVDMIMTPRRDVVGLNINKKDKKFYDIITESKYSRIPVFDGDKDTILGVLLAKDLLSDLKEKPLVDIDILRVIREPFIVNEKMKINELLKDMRKLSHHLAFVVDDKQKLEGIVTLEDIIEEIIGNIYDEHDLSEEAKRHLDDFTYILDGTLTIKELKNQLDISRRLNIDENVTLSDYIISELGELPKKIRNKQITTDLGIFYVLSVRNKAIHQLKFVLTKPKE